MLQLVLNFNLPTLSRNYHSPEKRSVGLEYHGSSLSRDCFLLTEDRIVKLLLGRGALKPFLLELQEFLFSSPTGVK